MGKSKSKGKSRKDKQKRHDEDVRTSPTAARNDAGSGAPPKLKRKAY